jgi:hypothetical protein
MAHSNGSFGSLASRFNYRGLRKVVQREPLSNEQIQKVAPSIFAQDKHESRSARYAYIPTIEVLNGLRKEGFEPFHVAQAGTRVEGKEGHTKHFLRLRHRTQIEQAQYLDRSSPECFEIIVINSHDGSSGYQMLAGWFRFVCQNGLIVGSTTSDVRIRHSGRAVEQVVEGAYEVLGHAESVRESRDGFASLQLSDGEQHAFARAALEFRFDEAADGERAMPVDASDALEARRVEDTKPDLWTTFNKVQENLINGGLRKRTNPKRREHTRPVTGIDGNVKLNRALWRLAQEMAALKTGSAAAA